MPSYLHEALVALFRDRPALARELLRLVNGPAVSQTAEVRLEPAGIPEVTPADYQADVVAAVVRGTKVRAMIIIEAQLGRDPQKHRSWPFYLASLRARHGCPVFLVVLTADRRTARWASRPIDMGHPGYLLRPIVIGPDQIPAITDRASAGDDPELAVLSALVHQRVDVTLAVMTGAKLDEDRLRFYIDVVFSLLGDREKAQLEALMQSGKHEYQSDFFKKLVAQGRAEGVAEGVALGKAEGVALGKAEGVALGKAEGVALGQVKGILAVLEARGTPIPAESRARIEACRDLATLDRWLALALAGAAPDDLR